MSSSSARNEREHKIIQGYPYVYLVPNEASFSTTYWSNGTNAYDTFEYPDYTSIITEKAYPFFKEKMLSMIKNATIVSGVECEYEDVYREFLESYGEVIASRLITQMMNEFFDNNIVVKALLHLISHRPYEELGGALNAQIALLIFHQDKRIKKFALKVIDNWDRVEMLPFLRGTQEIKERWLNDYKRRVIEHLEAKQNALLRSSD